MRSVYFLLIFSSALYSFVNSLNILGVFPYEGKSHFMVFKPLLLELSNRGHNVTVISHFPLNEPQENYNDISLADKSTVLEDVIPLETSYWSIVQISFFLVKFGTQNCKLLFEDENVQRLWKTEQKFDVILVEQFNSDCSLGLAHVLGAPVVGITSHMLMPFHFDRFGLYYNPSYMSHMFLDGGTQPTLYQRVERIILDTYLKLLYKYFCQRVDQNTIAKYFDNVPPLEELGQEIKILLLHQYFVWTGPNLFPASIKEIGGFHVQKPKKLPDALQKYIDEAEHGVIYISFGSMVRSTTLPKDKMDAMVGAISELPYRVIWKWDTDTFPGKPDNLMLSKWLPQNDILAHPKVLAFMSHCGCLSSTEAMHYGVPMVAMPVFGDQPGNAALIEESGLGVKIKVMELTKDLLLEKFKTVLNPEFRSRVKNLSRAWHDRPSSAMDTAVHWIEFAARHRNITSKPAVVQTPYYQYYMLDLIFIFAIMLILFFLLLKSLYFITKMIISNKKKVD